MLRDKSDKTVQDLYTEEPKTHPHEYGRLILYKDTKAIQWRKDRLFQQTVLKYLNTHK